MDRKLLPNRIGGAFGRAGRGRVEDVALYVSHRLISLAYQGCGLPLFEAIEVRKRKLSFFPFDH